MVSKTDKETKPAAGKAAEDVKAVVEKTETEVAVAAEAEALKQEEKPAKVEPEAAKAPVKEEAAPVVKNEEKTEEKAAKKSTAKKTGSKKTDKPELKPEVFIEYQGRQTLETAIIDKVKAAFVASGHRMASVKSLQIYVKPEEFKAYYVINSGKYTGAVDMF